RHDAGQADGRQKIEGTNLIRYYSQGIADETVLPLPGQAGHDFVITQMPPSETADTSCVARGVMVRADATVDGVSGALFAGVPTDFVCLNNGLLDTYNTGEFGHDPGCPYDPTDPPIERHVLSGTVRISGENTLTNHNIANAMGIVTSDGPGNCNMGSFTHQGSSFSAGFSCSVFDWGNGWNGYIELVYVNVGCSTSRLSFANVTGGSAKNNFNTRSITGGPPVTDPDPDPDPDPGPDPDPDPEPGEVSYVLFSGTLTAMQGNHTLTSITMSDGGTCALAGDRKSYSCSTAGFYGSWSGSLTFVSSAGVMCTGPGAGNTGGS